MNYNSNSRNLVFSLCVVLVCLIGCDPGTDPLDEETVADLREAAPVYAFTVPDQYADQANSNKEVGKLITAAMDSYLELVELPPVEKLSEIKEQLDKSNQQTNLDVEWFLRQRVASHALNQILVPGKTYTRAEEEAISFYVNQLVEYKNPNAFLVADALDVLQEHWTTSDIDHAAEISIAAASKLRTRICPDCATRLSSENEQALHEDKLEQLKSLDYAINRLRKYQNAP